MLRAAANVLGVDCPIIQIRSLSEAATVFEKALPVLGDEDADFARESPIPKARSWRFIRSRKPRSLLSTVWQARL